MREADLGAVLLVKAVEEADPGGVLLAHADRLSASREARRQAGGADPPHAPGALSPAAERLLVERSRKLLAALAARHAFVPAFLRLARGPALLGWLAILAALAAGAALSALDGSRRINILGVAVFGLVLWNLVVMAVLAVAWLASRGSRPADGRTWPGSLAHAGLALVGWLAARFAAFDAPLSAALRGFAAEWSRVARPLWLLRVKRLLHVIAASVGIGLVAGLYVRGIGLDYEAGWSSTFLNAPKVRAVAAVAYGPASALTGIAIPDERHFEAIRWRNGQGGEPAARWIHLLAATVLLFVVAPRLFAALLAAAAVFRLSRRAPAPPGLPSYFRRIFGDLLGIRRGLAAVVPYAYDPRPESIARLREWLPAALGQHLDVDVKPPVAYGDEEAWAAALARGGTDAADVVVLLLGLAATPEDENHGTIIERARERLAANGGTALLVVVDEGPYAARMGAQGGAAHRVAERRKAWEAFLEARGVKPCFVDLAQASPGEDAARAAVERLRDAVWQPAARGT